MAQHSVRTEDKQAIRLPRSTLGVSSSSLALAFLAVANALGFVHPGAAISIALACIATNAVLYGLFRSGLNLRFADPSLTKPQVYIGITLLMIGLYSVDIGRGISLGLCFFVFLFGIFRLSTRDLMTVTLYTLAAYALVINLLMHWRPESIQTVEQAWFN